MCGIVYMYDRFGNPVNNGILQQYDAQKTRGQQGFGLFDGQELNMVHEKKEEKILKWLVRYNSNLILFHHRFPTSTINVKRAAHPFSTKDYFGDTQYIMVHNGVISNDDELKKAHNEMGIEYYSQLPNGTYNDSEALMWDLALTLEGKQEKLTARGSIAFICLKLENKKLDKLYFGRNDGNPLKMFRTDKGMALSSEGEGDMIPIDMLHTYNYAINRLTTRPFTVPRYSTYHYRGSYPYSSSACSQKDYDNDWYWNRGTTYVPRSQSKPGDWLGDHLKNKFRKFLPAHVSVEDDPNFYDYDSYGNPLYEEYDSYDHYYSSKHTKRSKSGLYLPDTATIPEDTELTDDEIEEITETHVPDKSAVFTRMIEYIEQAEGVFETAYQLVEFDYEEMQNYPITKEWVEEGMLLEAVLAAIADDKEYKNEDSVSSLWEALCEQQKLAV